MISRVLIASPLIMMLFLAWIHAQEEIVKEEIQDEITKNFTFEHEMSIKCVYDNITYYGKDCTDGLKKFGKVVGWIMTAFLLTIFACCGCCCFCFCKIVHSGKKRNRGGQVIMHPQPPTVSTLA
ncbi:unnamed protein product [Diamesa serratosioi]